MPTAELLSYDYSRNVVDAACPRPRRMSSAALQSDFDDDSVRISAIPPTRAVEWNILVAGGTEYGAKYRSVTARKKFPYCDLPG